MQSYFVTNIGSPAISAVIRITYAPLKGTLNSSATINPLSYISWLHLIPMRLRDPESERAVTRIYLNGLPTYNKWKLLSFTDSRSDVPLPKPRAKWTLCFLIKSCSHWTRHPSSLAQRKRVWFMNKRQPFRIASESPIILNQNRTRNLWLLIKYACDQHEFSEGLSFIPARYHLKQK